MNEQFNLLKLKREKSSVAFREMNSTQQHIIEKIREFGALHQHSSPIYRTSATHPSYSPRNACPDMNYTSYTISIYQDSESKASEFHNLDIDSSCLCGCNMREHFVSVFRFRNKKDMQTIQKMLHGQEKYDLAQYYERNHKSILESNREAALFDLWVRFGGSSCGNAGNMYSNGAKVCGFSIPYELGNELYNALIRRT